VLTRTMLTMRQDDMVRLRAARRRGDAPSATSTALHLPDAGTPLARPEVARPLSEPGLDARRASYDEQLAPAVLSMKSAALMIPSTSSRRSVSVRLFISADMRQAQRDRRRRRSDHGSRRRDTDPVSVCRFGFVTQ
jgi:hypothetical protein